MSEETERRKRAARATHAGLADEERRAEAREEMRRAMRRTRERDRTWT